MSRRRKKDNKLVLRSPRDNRSPKRMQKRRSPRTKKPSKTSKTTLLIMIIALVAFVIGAGIGISMALDDSSEDNNKVEFENVTVEMTTNLNDKNNTTVDIFDDEKDDIDFNDKYDVEEYNLTNNTLSY